MKTLLSNNKPFFILNTVLLLFAAVQILPAEDKTQWLPLNKPLKTTVIKAFELKDEQRDKTLPIRITYADVEQKLPVIIFSHGALGSKDGYQPLIEYWASQGYICIQPTHEDSRTLMKFSEMLNKQNIWKKWSTRPPDIQLIISSLELIESSNPGLTGKMDLTRIGVGGHSFGAHTSQLLADTRLRHPMTGEFVSYADDRPIAFLFISPQGTGKSLKKESFSTVSRPAMVITGSHDDSVVSNKPASWRTEAYQHMPAGDKYLVFIDGAHHNFGGVSGARRFPGAGPENKEHMHYLQSTSLAFWNAYLKKDETAYEFLKSAESSASGGYELSAK